MATESQNCKVEGCKRPYRSKGYCNAHFKKWRRGGLTKKARYKTCAEEGCRKALFKVGMCETHYQSWIASKKPVPVVAAAEPTPAAPVAPAAEAKPAEPTA